MKLVIQIPAFNEEAHIPLVIDDIKKNAGPGSFVPAEIIVIDDGSRDDTAKVARAAGATDIVDLREHCGLGAAFKEGLRRAIALGADVIINSDADLQYRARDIGMLAAPILDNRADMVIGDRQIGNISGYPAYKYCFQTAGNFLASKLFKSDSKDVTSGFRALSKNAAEILIDNLSNTYTYTLESYCILLNKHMKVIFVPVSINLPLRKSRLIRNKLFYVWNFVFTIFKYYSKRRSAFK